MFRIYQLFACRHKHKKHRTEHSEDAAEANITDEDSLRHGINSLLQIDI